MHPFTEAEIEEAIKVSPESISTMDELIITEDWLRAHDDRVRADEKKRIKDGICELLSDVQDVNYEEDNYEAGRVHAFLAALSVVTPDSTLTSENI